MAGGVSISIEGEFMTESEAIAKFVEELGKQISQAGIVYDAMQKLLIEQLTTGELKQVMFDIINEEFKNFKLTPI
jgi:Arc/MetJ-type ribon-helix-helix transcriptional regulator